VGKEYGRKSGDKNIKILKGGKKGGISVWMGTFPQIFFRFHISGLVAKRPYPVLFVTAMFTAVSLLGNILMFTANTVRF
jgi:hypothetical protein